MSFQKKKKINIVDIYKWFEFCLNADCTRIIFKLVQRGNLSIALQNLNIKRLSNFVLSSQNMSFLKSTKDASHDTYLELLYWGSPYPVSNMYYSSNPEKQKMLFENGRSFCMRQVNKWANIPIKLKKQYIRTYQSCNSYDEKRKLAKKIPIMDFEKNEFSLVNYLAVRDITKFTIIIDYKPWWLIKYSNSYFTIKKYHSYSHWEVKANIIPLTYLDNLCLGINWHQKTISPDIIRRLLRQKCKENGLKNWHHHNIRGLFKHLRYNLD